jgi:hypothetical protein
LQPPPSLLSAALAWPLFTHGLQLSVVEQLTSDEGSVAPATRPEDANAATLRAMTSSAKSTLRFAERDPRREEEPRTIFCSYRTSSTPECQVPSPSESA